MAWEKARFRYKENLHCRYTGSILSIQKLKYKQHFFNDIPQDTPLHYAVKQKGNLDVVKFLAENGAEIDSKNSDDVS